MNFQDELISQNQLQAYLHSPSPSLFSSFVTSTPILSRWEIRHIWSNTIWWKPMNFLIKYWWWKPMLHIWWIKWKVMLVRIGNHAWFVSDWENGYWWQKIVTNISISIYLDKVPDFYLSSQVKRKNWWHQGWRKWKEMLVRLDNNVWWEDEFMGISMTAILLTNVCLFCTL